VNVCNLRGFGNLLRCYCGTGCDSGNGLLPSGVPDWRNRLAKVWQLSGCSIVGNMSEEHRPATDFLRVCKTGLRHEAENSALGIAFQAVT